MRRITVDVDDTFYANLNKLVESTSATSKAEVIRNAVAVYSFMKGSVPRSESTGQQVIDVPDADGTKIRMLIP